MRFGGRSCEWTYVEEGGEDFCSPRRKLCDLAPSSQTVDYSSDLWPLSESVWPFYSLLITPTHNRSAVQHSTQNKDVCGACGGDHAKQIALHGISQALGGMSPAVKFVFVGQDNNDLVWRKRNTTVFTQVQSFREKMCCWASQAKGAADMRKLFFFFVFAPQGCLPLVLMFDIKEDIEVEPQCITALMEQLDVFISIKPKPKQPSKVRQQAHTRAAWKV